MTHSWFYLSRLRVLSKGKCVYDQGFHRGVNIIRGDNGSGKSTIADFIFYVLGGEFENWKTAAARCDEVQAELVTAGGTLTIRRPVDKAQTPISVFFGPFSQAQEQTLDGWTNLPIRRRDKQESFSQIIFRSSGIPEAQSQGASNITMHQILRLLYSDQRTPAAFLFRYENFDTREIREATGDLICGLSAYELYELELDLRELIKKFDERARQLSILLASMPQEDGLATSGSIQIRLSDLTSEYERIVKEIDDVELHVGAGQVQEYVDARKKAADQIAKLRKSISLAEKQRQEHELDIAELESFSAYLEELSAKLPRAQASADIIGNIEFTHCPACLSELAGHKDGVHCVVCGRDTDPEKERSKYLRIKLDIDIQLRESHQLLADKRVAVAQADKELKALQREHRETTAEYTVKYDMSTSPREGFVAERHQRLGRIGAEREYLESLRNRTEQIAQLSREKADLQDQIDRKKHRKEALERAGQQRRSVALTRVSTIARSILRKDLNRQVEFQAAERVDVNFRDNSILVDGDLNFAESSNVIAKNAAILSLLFAATEDALFYHPRFVLLDNIEDKGMQQARSQNFQSVIVKMSEQERFPHQIVLTTSMMNPDLDQSKYVIGPYYTDKRRALNFEQEN